MSETYKLYLCKDCAEGTLGMETRLLSHEGVHKCEFCRKKKIAGLYEVWVKRKEK